MCWQAKRQVMTEAAVNCNLDTYLLLLSYWPIFAGRCPIGHNFNQWESRHVNFLNRATAFWSIDPQTFLKQDLYVFVLSQHSSSYGRYWFVWLFHCLINIYKIFEKHCRTLVTYIFVNSSWIFGFNDSFCHAITQLSKLVRNFIVALMVPEIEAFLFLAPKDTILEKYCRTLVTHIFVNSSWIFISNSLRKDVCIPFPLIKESKESKSLIILIFFYFVSEARHMPYNWLKQCLKHMWVSNPPGHIT